LALKTIFNVFSRKLKKNKNNFFLIQKKLVSCGHLSSTETTLKKWILKIKKIFLNKFMEINFKIVGNAFLKINYTFLFSQISLEKIIGNLRKAF